MGVPQLRDHSEELAAEIEKQLANSTVAKYDILTESQGMMVDLESEIRTLQSRQALADKAVKKNKDNVKKLVVLIEHDEALSIDLDAQIQAKLVAVHTLRERGVKLPNPETKDGE